MGLSVQPSNLRWPHHTATKVTPHIVHSRHPKVDALLHASAVKMGTLANSAFNRLRATTDCHLTWKTSSSVFSPKRSTPYFEITLEISQSTKPQRTAVSAIGNTCFKLP